MFRPTEACASRLREKASVFLTELHPAADAPARAAILARVRKRDFDATHHCAAWRTGVPVAEAGGDDDGEPAGTAGAPMLRVLEGEDLVDVLAVCIRWFGGTKLGTGGLVRAYTLGLQEAVALARAQGLLEEVRIYRHGALEAPAALAHLPFTLLGAFPRAEVLGQDFGPESARVRFRIPPEEAPALEVAWRERSRGGSVLWDGQG
jgi:putative IMPACT (imprinted ancient) family translation regulator